MPPLVAAAEDEAAPIVRRAVATGGSLARADEAPGWDALHAYHRDRQ
ncbi:MAG TPA: hypothetical protein VFG47_23655 [Geminicoccaceae bacterium]|nr:hypothetical protein [Geminicoccaceae bacterium]